MQATPTVLLADADVLIDYRDSEWIWSPGIRGRESEQNCRSPVAGKSRCRPHLLENGRQRSLPDMDDRQAHP